MPPAPRSPLSRLSDGALDVARRLFARELRGGADDAAVVEAAERVCARVADGLSRWFGPYGSLALITRALVRARAHHPALAGVAATAAHPPCLTGLAESARAHGAKATAEGVVAVLAALAELIGRLIGDDLAASLFEQSTPEPRTMVDEP